MKDDRELLEMAAKAAGYQGAIYCEMSGGQPAMHVPGVGVWAPLQDDGDAMRLAVMLNMDVMAPMSGGERCRSVVFAISGDFDGLSEPENGDPLAATRRAIVRAAAAIGSQK